MKKLKSKISIAFIIALSVILGVCGWLTLNFNRASAATSYDGTLFSIEKVVRYAGINAYGQDPNGSAYFSTNGEVTTKDEPLFNITTQDTAVMLNNAEIESTSNSPNRIEAVKITLLPDENYIIWLSASIKLNGVPIDCSGDGGNGNGINTGTIAYTANDTTCYKFIFYIDLTNVRTNDNELIEQASGYYEINIEFHSKENLTNTTYHARTINFGLYILNEENYINSNSSASDYVDTNPRDNVGSSNASTTSVSAVNSSYALQSFYNNNNNTSFTRNHVEPRLYNTERIDRYVINPSSNYYVNYKYSNNVPLNNENAELNFFNFNNEQTVDYDGNLVSSSDELLFPTYTYDASKYNISWTYTYKSVESYTVTSTFTITDNTGVVTFLKNGTDVLFTTSATNNNGMYIVNIPFTEIGEYSFTIRYTVRQYIVGSTSTSSTLSNTFYVIDSLSDKVSEKDASSGAIIYVNKQKEHLVGDVKLSIFGYELYYTDEDNIIVDESDNSSSYSLAKFKGITSSYKYITDYTFLNSERLTEDKADRLSVETADGTQKSSTYNEYYNVPNKTSLTKMNLGTYTTISSTNQAPVEFKYLGIYSCEEERTNYSYSYYIYYPYGKTSNLGVTINQVTNSTRFTANGTYEVVVLYSYYNYKYYPINTDINTGEKTFTYTNIQGGSTYVHAQIFTFEIANTPPTITIIDDNGTILNKDDYTNQSVKIKIAKSNSPFNVEPRLTCAFTDFDTKNTVNETLSKTTESNGDNVYSATKTGKYKITVNYGQGRKSSQITEFYIDKTPIANPTLYTNNNIQINQNATNSSFYMSYLEKASGAPITVKYLYMPISKISNFNVNNIFIGNNESIIKNGFTILQCFDDSSSYNKNAIINTPGFYFFTLQDKAGNIAYKFVLYDTTAPLILQKESVTDATGTHYTDWYLATYMNNIVTSNTVIRWGTTKAITLDNSIQNRLLYLKSLLDEYANVLNTYANNTSNADIKAKYSNSTDLANFKSLFCNENGNIKSYIKITISKISVVFAGTSNIVVQYLTASAVQENQEVTFYTTTPKDIVVDPNLVTENSPTSVRLYEVTSQDYLSNHRNALVEVNLDNSLVLVYSYSDTQVKYEENNESISVNYLRLYNRENNPTNYGTNRQALYVTFKNGVGPFEIETLSYSFYALDLSKDGESSINYPYSSIASISNYVFDIANAKTHNGTNGLSNKNNLIIGPLNASSNDMTTAGIYVIRRVYKGDEKEYEGTGDTKEKIYTFLVDRTGIITVLEEKVIGEFITLGLGVANKQSVANAKVKVSGTDFLVSLGSGETLFTTNVVPIFYSLPENKYYFGDIYSTLKPLNLNIKIYYNPTNLRFDNTNLQGSTFVIYKEGYYQVVITDTTGYNTSTQTNLSANSFSFIFSIEYEKPTGTFTKVVEASDGSNVTTEIPSTTTSVNSKTLSFYWTDPLTKFDAEIDPTKVTVTSYPTNGGSGNKIYTHSTSTTSNIKLTTEKIKVNGNEITKYILNMNYYAQIQAKYVIHLEYVGTTISYISGNSMFVNDIEIYVDTTSPNYNAQLLINQDQYMSMTEKENMLKSILNTYREENGSEYYLNFENYVFVVDENFKLNSLTNDKFWLPQHDTYSVYIRKYARDLRNNATSDGSTLQSLIPSDMHYNEANYSTQYKFSPYLKEQNGYVYTEIKYDEPISMFEEYGGGYYEIIEVDEAGNTSIYTVYYQTSDSLIYDMTYTSKLDERNYKVSDLSNYELNDKDIEMVFTNLTSKVDWFKLQMTDSVRNNTVTIEKTYNKSKLDENEFNSLDEIITQIQNFIVLTEEMKVTGASFKLTFFHPSSSKKNFVVVYNTPGELVDLIFEVLTSPTNTIIVTVPEKTHTYIKLVDIYQGGTDASGNAVKTFITRFTPNYDTNLLSYSLSASPNMSYLFICTDNFGRIYSKIKNIDIADVSELIFDSETKTLNGLTYTAGSVALRYQSKLYKLSMEIDGVDIAQSEFNSMFTVRNEGNGVIYYQLVQLNPDINLDKTYNIYLTPILQMDDEENYVVQPLSFRLYTMLPTLKLTTSAGKDLEYAIEGATAKDIYIYYNKTDYLFDVSVTAVCLCDDGTIKNYTNIANGNCLSTYGVYTVTVQNTLGASYSFHITKKVNSDPYYTVYKDASKTYKLQMSKTKFTIMIAGTTMYMDWYFSTYDSSDPTSSMAVYIEKNEDLNLIDEEYELTEEQSKIESEDGKFYTTKVYYIHTNTTNPNNLTYERYIAVTFLDETDNLLKEFKAQDASNPDSTPKTIVSEQGSINTSLSVTFIESKVRVTWTPYFELPQNLIYLVYYYEGVEAGTCYNGTQGVTLMESGYYQLEFYDYAGNRHLFGTNSATSSYSYEIVMYNEILTSVNGEAPIDNAIYNGPVTLEVLDLESLSGLQFTATLNGNPIVLTKTETTHVLEEFGYYEIRIDAKIMYNGRFVPLSSNNENMSTNASAAISKTITFTILNSDQARYAYTYSGNTIYSVYFNNRNVTTEVLNGLTKSTSITLSADTLGYGGIYTIYAKQVFDGIRPDAHFSFQVWINNETPIITSNIDIGGSTTKELFIYFNPYLIYSQVGVCDIVITRSDGVTLTYALDPANKGVEDELQTDFNGTYEMELKEIGTYIIQVKVNNNTLTSFVITKAEKLNTVAIIVICLTVIAIVGGGFLFIKLRTRMRVK